MSGGIMAADRLVEPGGDHLAVAHDDRAHRHFADGGGIVCLVDGEPHHREIEALGVHQLV